MLTLNICVKQDVKEFYDVIRKASYDIDIVSGVNCTDGKSILSLYQILPRDTIVVHLHTTVEDDIYNETKKR